MPYRRNADIPLLPYEKQLIEALGCSEAEYCEFIQQLERRAYVRPAGYEHIPDIRMDPVTILVNLVIGIALSAASYLLTPKPKLPSATTGGMRQAQLGGVQGIANYTPTQGFESIQDLAAYGNVVPIAFTKREDHSDYSTGGLLISPSLVWSRMKSWGTFQILEIVAVAGQGPMTRPERAGILLGNNAIDGIFDDQLQFYWNGGYEVTGPNSRLRGANLRYGKLFVPAVPSYNEEAFVCPTKNGTGDTGFCSAFTPSNQTRFGAYAAIPNGTPFRPNWEILSVLEDQDGESRAQQVNNQQKFVSGYLRDSHPYGGGPKNVLSGMPGTGVNYARHVGIISHNGYTVPDPVEGVDEFGFTKWTGSVTEERQVNIGDVIEMYIGDGRQKTEPFQLIGDSAPVRVDDVRSAIDAEMVEFDRSMSVGAIFMIGRTVWQVISRTDRTFNPGDDAIVAKLKCLEAWSEANRKIGLVNRKAINNESFLPYGVDIEETFYPVLKVDFGNVRNTRPCEVTEIGIKSQVWAQFNGITNFNTIPAPYFLAEYNKKNIQVREGKNNSYGRRICFFAVDVRPANSEPFLGYSRNNGFVNIGAFAVSGSTPQDIFSFVRIKHPLNAAYEYRLRPFNAAVLTQQGDGNGDIFMLNGSVTNYEERSVETYMGTFTIGGRGRYIKPRDYYTHPQMAAIPELIDDLVYGEWVQNGPFNGVQFIKVFNRETNAIADQFQISNVLSYQLDARGDADADPYFDNLPTGYKKTFEPWGFGDGARSFNLKLTLEAYEQAKEGTARNKWWRIVNTEASSYTGTWSIGETFIKNAVNFSGVRYGFEYQINSRAATYVQFDTPKSATRVWETYSGIAELSHYGDLIQRSCDNGPEHEVIYVNESTSESTLVEYDGCAMVGLKLQSSNNFTSLDQLRCYIKNGLDVERLTDGGVGSSNLFTDLVWYLATNTDTGAGGIINSTLLDRNQLAATGSYLRANDLYFDDVIAEPINLRSWLADKAPSMLCYIAIKNGLLSVNPALPTDASNVIANVAPPISAMFTDGNIIEGSLNVEWLELEERKLFQAAVIYRRSPMNRLPRQETVVVRYAEPGADALPIEEFNLPHVTSRSHAIKAAKYFLALRKHVTHTISFQTLPYGLSLAPGQFIMVAVEQSPYSPANNGIVAEDGTVVSVSGITDGSYPVYFWDRTQTTIGDGTLIIAGGIAQNLRNTVFSVKNAQVTNQAYQVEAIEVNEDGIVTIKASSFPLDSSSRSLIAADVVSSSTFEIIGEDEV